MSGLIEVALTVLDARNPLHRPVPVWICIARDDGESWIVWTISDRTDTPLVRWSTEVRVVTDEHGEEVQDFSEPRLITEPILTAAEVMQRRATMQTFRLQNPDPPREQMPTVSEDVYLLYISPLISDAPVRTPLRLPLP